MRDGSLIGVLESQSVFPPAHPGATGLALAFAAAILDVLVVRAISDATPIEEKRCPSAPDTTWHRIVRTTPAIDESGEVCALDRSTTWRHDVCKLPSHNVLVRGGTLGVVDDQDFDQTIGRLELESKLLC